MTNTAQEIFKKSLKDPHYKLAERIDLFAGDIKRLFDLDTRIERDWPGRPGFTLYIQNPSLRDPTPLDRYMLIRTKANREFGDYRIEMTTTGHCVIILIYV